MWPFKSAPKELPRAVVKAAVVTQGPVINPDSGDVYYAEYRADAIARCIEQRRAEGVDLHPEHTQLFSEAMTYGWRLVQAGKWTTDQVETLRKRLEG
jgi:hypothetical protein